MEAGDFMSSREFIRNYVYMHIQHPNNVAPEDYRHFNHTMFRAVKLNALYTIGTYFISYKVLKSFILPSRAMMLSVGYCSW